MQCNWKTEKSGEKSKHDLTSGSLNAEHMNEYIDLVVETFKVEKHLVAEWFQNRLIKNPYQHKLPGLGVALWDKDKLIGCRGIFAQPWWLENRSTFIAFYAHTSIKREYRKQGLGIELIKKSAEYAPISGSTSSGVATQPIHQKLGYFPVGNDNDFFTSRISYRHAFVKRLRSRIGGEIASVVEFFDKMRKKNVLSASKEFDFQLITRCDSKFDSLWERAKRGYPSCFERSSAYLNYRIFDCPTCPLHLAGIYEGNGPLRAFGIWHVVSFDKHSRMAVLRDLFSEIDDREALKAFLAHVIEYWVNNGISWARFELAHPRLTSFFRSLGFKHVPSRGNRYYMFSHLPIGQRTRSEWFRSGLDGDYFDLNDSSFLQ
jgi:GNAT superfamily N-acetyltransferase